MGKDEGIPFVSIIMAAYNTSLYIGQSIESVINQSWKHWELIIINDGSDDNTNEIALSFNDERIRYFEQRNMGVAAARNKGLKEMKGNYFCFLDSDDLMPSDSLLNRLEVFKKNPDLAFVGGSQIQKNKNLQKVLKYQKPDYHGYPLKRLIALDPGCFINCGTWLIKRNKKRNYQFPEAWRHCEDLAFLFSIAEDGKLGYTEATAQIYRRWDNTAMTNIEGLEEGYSKYYNLVRNSGKASMFETLSLKFKIMKIMFLSYFSQKKVKKAIKSFLNLMMS